MINISGLTPIEDPSYRYKMPRVLPKVEGRGNGIKTVIVNITDIATSLNRDPSEITKYFGFELGAQTTMGSPDGDDRYIVNGSHSTHDLQNLIHKYIENFVLCKNCHLPETHYKIKGGDSISQKCVACGSKDLCDMTHKLTTFILKQHKKMKSDAKSASAAGSSGKEGKEKKEKKEKKSRGDEASAATGGDDVDEKKKEKKLKKKKAAAAAAALEEEEVAVDETLEGDTELEALESALDQFKLWLTTHSDISSALPSSLTSSQLAQFLEELRSCQTLSSLPPSYRYLILMGTLFTSQCIASNEILKYKSILSNLLTKQNHIQQRQLIAATEWLIGVKFGNSTSSPTTGETGSSVTVSLVRMFPVLLKQLYDEDLIEEEVLFDWFHDELKNEYTVDGSIISMETLEQLKEASKPFIVWLQQADEEGDEEEDEEDEEA